MSTHDDEQTAEDREETRLEFSDTVHLDAPKDEVWETISDPETLTAAVPGAESIERVSERKYTCEITRGISHLTVSLSGEAEFVEMDPPDHVVTRASAFDSKTGSDFEILAGMEMIDADDGGTDLAYTAEVEFTGGVASMSNRLLRPIIGRDVNTYFENIRGTVETD